MAAKFPYITKFYVQKYKDRVIKSVKQIPRIYRQDVIDALREEGIEPN